MDSVCTKCGRHYTAGTQGDATLCALCLAWAIEVKTIGELVDELIIVNVKIFTMEDIKRESTEEKIVADMAKKIQALNDQRSQLKNAITRRLEPGAREDVKVKT